MSGATPSRALEIELPGWVNEVVDWSSGYPDDEARMRLAIALSRENVDRRTGGPFAAAVFESDTGALVAVGVNCVERLGNAMPHGEVVALMFAQRRVGSFTLGGPAAPARELVSSCEPCAMCVGAMFHARIRRVVFGAADPKTGAAGSTVNLFEEKRLNHHALVQGGVLAAECGALLSGFFASRR